VGLGFDLPRHGRKSGSNKMDLAHKPLGGRWSTKRINPFVAPLCGPRTHALVDRGLSQYWLVRQLISAGMVRQAIRCASPITPH